MQNPLITFTLFNPNNKPRWIVNLIEVDNQFEIHDTAKYSLFKNPLAIGKTSGKASNAFLNIEEDLIKGL